MRTEIQMLSNKDRLTHVRIMLVRNSASTPFDVIYFESESGCLSAYLPLEWHNMMLEAIRKAYPSPICPACYSIHIPGTACETHESYTHTTDPRLESPVS